MRSVISYGHGNLTDESEPVLAIKGNRQALDSIIKAKNIFPDLRITHRDFPLNEMKLNPKISAQILSNKVGISKRKIEENIAKLKNMNIIIREGGTRGYWEVRDTGST